LRTDESLNKLKTSSDAELMQAVTDARAALNANIADAVQKEKDEKLALLHAADFQAKMTEVHGLRVARAAERKKLLDAVRQAEACSSFKAYFGNLNPQPSVALEGFLDQMLKAASDQVKPLQDQVTAVTQEIEELNKQLDAAKTSYTDIPSVLESIKKKTPDFAQKAEEMKEGSFSNLFFSPTCHWTRLFEDHLSGLAKIFRLVASSLACSLATSPGGKYFLTDFMELNAARQVLMTEYNTMIPSDDDGVSLAQALAGLLEVLSDPMKDAMGYTAGGKKVFTDVSDKLIIGGKDSS